MNAVRLPVNVADFAGKPELLRQLDDIVQRANQLELLVIIAAQGPPAQVASFWTDCAAFFRANPNVMFDAIAETSTAKTDWRRWRRDMDVLVHAIRAAGATQPVLVAAPNRDTLLRGLTAESFVRDPNVIYEIAPSYVTTRSDADRDRNFGFLASRIPILANDWDPQLDRKSAECASLPADPTAAESLIEDNLSYFEKRGISWTVSEFAPGKLITDWRYQASTTLESGWTCGEPGTPPAGIGGVVQFHLFDGVVRGLFPVNSAGNFDLPRGSMSIAYGPVMAERDALAARTPLPTRLAGVTVEVRDSAGVTRDAPVSWVSAGWGQVNFIVPEESALGPAEITLVRDDGSRTPSNATIVDVAPGIWTAYANGRGAVIGFVSQDGAKTEKPTFACGPADCRATPIALARGISTRVRLTGSGFRHAPPGSDLRVTIGGVPVPVVSYGASPQAGTDNVVIDVSPELARLGETDLICFVNGHPSNVARINLVPAENAVASRHEQ